MCVSKLISNVNFDIIVQLVGTLPHILTGLLPMDPIWGLRPKLPVTHPFYPGSISEKLRTVSVTLLELVDTCSIAPNIIMKCHTDH